MALKWVLTEKFREYCMGSKIVVYKDNNPLSRIKESKLTATDMRWVAQIEPYDVVLKYKPGEVNVKIDNLSRKFHGEIRTLDKEETLNMWPIIRNDELRKVQRADVDLGRVMEALQENKRPNKK